MLTSLNITIGDKILIISPHPDDEAIGTGGLLCMFPAQCSIIVLSNGAQGRNNITADECRQIRQIEFIDEMKYLGIATYKMLDLPDGKLMKYIDCLENLDLSKYNKIFVTSKNDRHSDHIAAYISVINALKRQNNTQSDLYLYEVHNSMENATHYLDITENIDKVKAAVRFHKSQLSGFPYDEYTITAASYRAFQNRLPGRYIEVFQKDDTFLSEDFCYSTTERELQKFKQFYHLLTSWMLNTQAGSVSEVLKSMDVNTVAVYGYAELGRILRNELEKGGIKVKYVIDKKITSDSDNLTFYKPQKNLPPADIIIVTAVFYFEEIKKELESLGYEKIISLSYLVDKLKQGEYNEQYYTFRTREIL